MLVLGFPAGSFATNAYLLATGPGRPCLVVDPGQRSDAALAELVARHRLEPAAVLLTHAHMDHTWDAVPVSRRYGVPVHVHPEDRFMLGDPAAGLPDTFPRDLLAGHPCAEPSEVRDCGESDPLPQLDGLHLTTRRVGGHTPGSVVFHCAAGEDEVLFTGDALLAGSLGHTDGPGGDPAALRDGLARACRGLGDATAVLPGHGERTTLGHARTLHPFL